MTMYKSVAIAMASMFIAAGCATRDRGETKAAGGSPEIVTEQGAKAGTTLSDAQVIRALYVANAGEVEAGQLAKDAAMSQSVRDFAEGMITDHSAANDKLTAVIKKCGIEPADSELTTDMKANHQKMMDDLRKKSGADFDKAYMSAMVDGHEKVLKTIDSKLLPNAKNEDVENYLREVRPTVAKHLEHAKGIKDAPVATR